MRGQENKSAMIRPVLIGTGTGFAVLVGLILLTAGLISSGTLSESGMWPCVLVSVAAGVLVGSLLAVRIGSSMSLLTGMLVGFCVFAVLFCVGLAMSYPNVKHVPAIAAVTMLCGTAGALPKLLGHHRRKHKHALRR